MNQCSFFFQLQGKGRRSLVVTAYRHAFLQEVAGYGTHANAACSYEIHSLNIFQFHFAYMLDLSGSPDYLDFLVSLMTSSAMMSAEFGNASFSIFSLSVRRVCSFCTVSKASEMTFSGASASFT